jgi:hypothetical protein
MSSSQITVEHFRNMASERLRFLESLGFRREQRLEETTPTIGTVVYLGKNVGFVFSVDMRDQCVDGQVVKVRDGQMKRNWEGGSSSDIFTHLVKHTKFRGSPAGRGGAKGEESSLRQMIDSWVDLLKQAGQSLLNDTPDSLP